MRSWLRRLIGQDTVKVIGCDHAQPASAFTAYIGSQRDGMTDFGPAIGIKKDSDGYLHLVFTKAYHTGTIERADVFYAGHYMCPATIFPSVTCVDGSATVDIPIDLYWGE